MDKRTKTIAVNSRFICKGSLIAPAGEGTKSVSYEETSKQTDLPISALGRAICRKFPKIVQKEK